MRLVVIPAVYPESGYYTHKDTGMVIRILSSKEDEQCGEIISYVDTWTHQHKWMTLDEFQGNYVIRV